MSDIALVNNDIMASNFGDIFVVDDNSDIIQMAINNIVTIFGTNEFHPNIGNKAHNRRHKMSENNLKEVANECKNAILQDSRVMNVIEVIAKNISTKENYGLCDISFVLITASGMQLSSNVTISLV